ncbi:hypothetical protein EDD16DRAFT_1515367 [Pisolithus croceorrhizus]|nr:hypothetical protein EDD16DRAFT_1515367 [Pisolithus croceorrhizus]
MSTGWTGVGSSLEISAKHEYASRGAGGGHESESGSGREVDRERLSDDSALPLRVAHATVVPRGGEGALTSGAETHLVKSFGSAAFGYPHPPMIPACQTVLESAPGYFSRHFPAAKYSLHESQFARIWPFRPQKKQKEYNRQDSFEALLRGTEGSSKLQKMGIPRESAPRDCENANGECEEETEVGKLREHDQNRGYET